MTPQQAEDLQHSSVITEKLQALARNQVYLVLFQDTLIKAEPQTSTRRGDGEAPFDPFDGLVY
jgi:hypothetical protein